MKEYNDNKLALTISDVLQRHQPNIKYVKSGKDKQISTENMSETDKAKQYFKALD